MATKSLEGKFSPLSKNTLIKWPEGDKANRDLSLRSGFQKKLVAATQTSRPSPRQLSAS
jgi:hypothetical protein